MSTAKASISDEDLNNFCSVTGASIDRARFYVEAANGDLGIAIESFFENGGGESMDMEDVTPIEPSATTRGAGLKVNYSDDDNDDDDDDKDPSYNPFSKLSEPKNETRQPSTRNAGKIFSLNDMNNGDDEDEKGQAFYAGGSQTSGQQILGPSKKKNPEKLIKDLFEKAKEHGAQEVDPSEGASTSKKSAYHGTGYRLGTGNEPSEVIPGAKKPKEPKTSILKLWKNGFNIDDGELRSYEDEKNKEFLASIQRGELPRELIQQAQGGEVHLDMQDHRDEEFVPPKQAYKLYSTQGHKLGASSSPAPIVSTASSSDKATNEENAKKNLGLDSNKPSTQIQLRLSDGSRLIIKLNITHKLKDIRSYLNTARPEYASRTYSLMTSFPNKELTNNDETIEEGKLQSATIIQKLL